MLLISHFFPTIGRLFDFHVLDMIELGIEKFVSLSDIKVRFKSISDTSLNATHLKHSDMYCYCLKSYEGDIAICIIDFLYVI